MEILDNNGLGGKMTYEELQGQTRIEMSRCLQVLGNDISAWTGVPRLEGMGLSQAQRIALVDLMQVMQQRQNNAFTAIDKQLPAPKFADGQAELLLQMTGAQELWHVFRTILEQHEDDSTKTAVKTATRIAGDCYQFCIRRARSWHGGWRRSSAHQLAANGSTCRTSLPQAGTPKRCRASRLPSKR